MAKYKAYPEYKDSGVEWLGKIPNHWTTLAIKHVAQLNPSKSCIGIEKMKGMCSFIPMEKLKFNSLSVDDVKDVSDVYNGYTYFENEDILIAKVTPCFENKNMVVAHDLHNGIGFGSSEIYVLRCNDIINNDFLFYRLQEDNFMSIAEGAMTGAGGLKRVPSDILNNFKFGLPRIKEQSIIVNFLKHETAKIDILIEKQQQLIELLKEKRQAVISHAVTKGLNPDVPMKDSGVEWLGEVPEHWIVRRLKHTASLQSGIPKGKDLTGKSSISVPMLRVANVQDGYLDLEDVHAIDIEPSQLERYLLRNGDVLMNEGGDNDQLGRGAVWSAPIDNCIHQNHVFAIRPQRIESDWLDMLTRVAYAKFHFYRVAKQSTNLASISSTNIKETPLLIPPVEERVEILEFIKLQLEKLKKTEELSSNQVALLQERRTALISAAVTGKIDVRDWVAPDKQDVEESQEATA
ncbi:restriction endonuclease subunit S [Klebsiella quasipneumoniae subsp. similipneumoniae]|uniref:restriction endonuclease subunit S n=1 Tax=Klebsiella quasipneumoniae TaxID=1463165 RepID=UPI001082DE2B|nr:restriction endonuclease subunit S [Klebsiella quasipneumoniae]HCI6377928.1 restriction endonuclease subunit S [Klebsiella quasipneumoniae subsp. similipneumoniae]EKW2603715.1 restriction endonuclease subunit S [Klebsiella quasipneumoniae]MBK2831833.1 restriction endonuclease subunit S [Klebsiella quasipneumoniae]MDZ0983895.1 restriction endonuclease subunit S [Klebsiella quasipneumoniae]VGC97533.1 putative restriction endonuclease S subunit [Klebsiella quasipneumoniae]